MSTHPQPAGLPVPNPTASYWHKEPSEKLLGHRTTPDLPPEADIVIVGSGITGAVAAKVLRERNPGLSVLMLEAREACWGATGRNGGHCQPAMYAAQPHIASFELRNYSYLKALVEDFSIPCDWRSTTGVHAYFSTPLFQQAKDVVRRLSEKYPDLAANVAVVTKGEGGSPSWLLAEERRELTLEGLRIPHAEGAVVQWHAASLWPYKLVAFILERLLAAAETGHGDTKTGSFNLQTNTPVTRLSKIESNKAVLESPKGGGADEIITKPTWTVHTPRGGVRAKAVLLATNGYTSHLLPQFSDLIVPTRGQVAALCPPGQKTGASHAYHTSGTAAAADEPSPPVDIGHTFYLIGSKSEHLIDRDDYLVQRPPPMAELVLGGGRYLARNKAVGVWNDDSLDGPTRLWLTGELPGVLNLRVCPPALKAESGSQEDSPEKGEGGLKKEDLTATHEWTGIMGYSRDNYPWVGPVPAELSLKDISGDSKASTGGEGLFICAGYTGHGMPNAALCARAVAEMMTGAREVDLPQEFEVSVDRVVEARKFESVEAREAEGIGGMFGFLERG